MALGKGLSALINEEDINSLDQGYINNLEIEKIVPNRYQPRLEIQQEKLEELVSSIKEHGVIEPLIVTKKDNGKFELIAGERRLRAAKKAELKNIPVVVKEASPQQMLELAVVENVQRADLNSLEEGLAFQQLVDEFGLSHQEISDKVGLSRPAVANKIRLLKLPDVVKKGLLESKIEEGHARALLGLTSQAAMLQAYKMIIRDGMSVRSVEELVRRLNQGHKKPKRSTSVVLDRKTKALEDSMKSSLSERLSLRRSKKGGKIIIPFKSDEELQELYKKITS